MFEEIFSFESFALVCIFVALGAYLVWQQIKAAGRNIEATLERQPEDAVSGQAQEDEAQRRRMVHEADSDQTASEEPPVFRNWVEKEDFLAQAEADRQLRSRRAVQRAQEAAWASKGSSAAEHEIFLPVIAWSSSGSPSSSSSSDCSSSSSDSGGGSCGGSSD